MTNVDGKEQEYEKWKSSTNPKTAVAVDPNGSGSGNIVDQICVLGMMQHVSEPLLENLRS